MREELSRLDDERKGRKKKKKKKKRKLIFMFKRATTTNDDSLKTHSYSRLLDYLSPCSVRTISDTFFVTYINITLMHEYRRITLEKLDLCRLLDVFYDNIHDSFRDFL
jgi:hypothetical protein